MILRNNRKDDTLIISVESRKGGVGKTTAALCMARVLRKSGYTVLMLDLDITGTNAADFEKSPFLKNFLHIVKQGTDSKAIPVNLIEMFDGRFMVGETIPKFITGSTSDRRMSVDLKMVNVMGSQIYKTEDDKNNGLKVNNDVCVLERPSILFDDLHSFWLLDFIKGIIQNFEEISYQNDQSKIAIILDNSPGYVGISPAIHEWLTDRGPDLSKFLIVSSSDIQDLRACGLAIASLNKIYSGKWKTSRLFVEASNGKSIGSVSKDQEAFFMRLATSADIHPGRFDTLSYYKDSNKLFRQNINQTNGQDYCDFPERYIAAIVNKVPLSIKTGELSYSLLEVFDRQGSILKSFLYDKNNEQICHELMIYYDEYIENLFLPILYRNKTNNESHFHRLSDTLRNAEEELRANSSIDVSRTEELDRNDFRHLRTSLIKANDILSQARLAMESANLSHLSRLIFIHDEWLPHSIVPRFRSALMEVLREGKLPYFDMGPFDYRDISEHPESIEVIRDISVHIRKELRHFHLYENDSKHTMQVFINALSQLVFLSLPVPLKHVFFEIDGIFAAVIAIELKHWEEKNYGSNSKLSLQHFLAQETVNKAEIEKEEFLLDRLYRHSMIREGKESFTNFYKACTYAQARTIDLKSDSRFILELLQFMVENEIAKEIMFPYIRGIAEDVIVNKSVNHEDAPKKMDKAIQTAEYLRDFDKVLELVKKKWEVS